MVKFHCRPVEATLRHKNQWNMIRLKLPKRDNNEEDAGTEDPSRSTST